MRRSSIIGAASLGTLAGSIGTLAMDLVWYARHKREGGEGGFADWEFTTGTVGYEEAGVPAQVGKRLLETLFGQAPPPEKAGLVNDVVHWLTGMGWGTAHGVVAAFLPVPVALAGPLTGAVAWGTSYAVLSPAGFYKPIWEYDSHTLWKDLSAHLVFGSVTAIVFRALARHRR